ncbi:hypothetical protein R1sor_021075 [Riccia sorocarpa]|uniref:Uncharacterized protein n=1 Tax=Riccia sorocarpa TaxID=122646 RepID=A0ABD3GI47_9MARC
MGGRRSNDSLDGEPVASNFCIAEFKRKRCQQNIPEISRKLEDDFGCPDSSDSTPPNSPINLSASGSSPGSDSEDSTDFSPVKLRPRKFNFSPPRLLPALMHLFTFAMSHPRDLLRRADFVAPEVRSARRPPQEAPQDVDEDAGPFLQDPPCASGSALSGDVGTETTYRFKETLREPKPPRKYRGNDRLRKLHVEDRHLASLDSGVRQPTGEAFILLEWLDSFFLSHCERQPGDGRYHLPNNFTKKEVYDHYTTDMLQVHQCLSYSSFKRYWLKYYPFVTNPTTNKFSVCDFCELYKS